MLNGTGPYNMCNIYFHENFYVNWCSELVLLYPYLLVDDSRFNYIKNKNVPIKYVKNIESSDYVILPYKWRGLDNITQQILKEVKEKNKKIIIFFNDDSCENININENDGYIFRTSFSKSTKKNNEFALPPFFDDYFRNILIEHQEIKLNIGFCGYDHFHRKKMLNIISKNNLIESNFIIRKSFLAKEIDFKQSTNDFNENLENNLFGFTSRGSGNFSYRFYQILSMGRIPVFLNTDCVLPFENIIDYNNHCLIVDLSESENIDKKIIQFYNNKTKEALYQMQINNRKLYEEYFSPLGFIKNFNKIIPR